MVRKCVIIFYLLNIYVISLLLLITSAEAKHPGNISLERNHVSVWYFPPLEDDYRYTKHNMEGMIKLISSKFGTIVTDNAPIVTEDQSLDLRNISNKAVSVSIVVAEHNKRSKPEEFLQVMLSFDLSPSATYNIRDKNISYLNSFVVAKHYADKANEIHPGTVETLILHHDDYLRVTNDEREGHKALPDNLHSVWGSLSNASAGNPKYKLGVTISLDLCKSSVEKGANDNSTKLLSQFVQYADVVIPIIYAEPHLFEELSPEAMHVVHLQLLRNCERALHKIKPQIETIPFVICNPPKSHSFETASKFFKCWELMSDWALTTNRKVIMFEAFDRFEQDYVNAVGWWRIKKATAHIVNETSFWEKAQVDLHPSEVNTDGISAVMFDHRVRSLSTDLLPYSEQDVMSMLEVVFTRFTTVVTTQMPYIAGVESSENLTWIPQLVAKLNTESKKPRSAILTFHDPGNNPWQLNYFSSNAVLNVEKALEVAQVANKIFPGSVSILAYDGVRYSDPNYKNVEALKETLSSGLGNRSMESGYKIGLVMDVAECRRAAIWDFDELTGWVKLVILDLSVSALNPREEVSLWSKIDRGFNCAKNLRMTFPGLEIMFAINCKAIANQNSKTFVEDLAICANAIGNWGKNNGESVILSQAFDIPFAAGSTNVVVDPDGGWWKLRNKTAITITKESFVEKIEELDLKPLPNVEKPPEDSGLSTSAAIWIGVGIGFLLLLGLVILQTLRLMRKQALLSRFELNEFFNGAETQENTALELQDDNENVFMRLKYDAKMFEIPKREFQFGTDSNNLLGKGNYGVVHKIIVSRFPNEVAVKAPHAGVSKQTMKSLLSEIKIMSFVGNNTHVVQFLGAFTKEIQQGIVYIVTELCELGSLQSYLHRMGKIFQENGPSATLNEMLIRFCREIAIGMKYIAEKGVIHGDLSARNVLLDSNAICKISDFGLSKKLYQYQVYTQTQQAELPWRWLAVETLKRLEFSTKSDVCAYGVTVWEIFSFGDIPYPGQVWDWDFIEKLECGLRMKKPELASADVYSKLMDCWNIEAVQRPSFAELTMIFRVSKENDYIVT